MNNSRKCDIETLCEAPVLYVTRYLCGSITMAGIEGLPVNCLGAEAHPQEPIPNETRDSSSPLFGLSPVQARALLELKGEGCVVRLPDIQEEFSYPKVRAQALAKAKEMSLL